MRYFESKSSWLKILRSWQICNIEMKHTIQKYYPYIFISLVAIIWNVLTMHNQLPWMDEVMLADTPANMFFYGQWTTTAYNAMGEGTFPFATYMPLYQWLLYGWIRLLGFSFMKVRMFEIATYFILGGAILKFLKSIRDKDTSVLEQCIFTICFWGTSILALAYRMGRPDFLGALMAVMLAYYIFKSLKVGVPCKWQIVFFSMATIMAGIQSVVWCLSMLIFSIFVVRTVKKLLYPTALSFLGFSLGMITTSMYMWYHGALKAFYVGLMQVSGTFYKLWQISRVYILPLLGREVKEIGDLPPDENIFSRLSSICREDSTIILIIAVIVIILLNKPVKQWTERNIAFLFGVFGLFTIVFYTLAGRFAVYYHWVAVLPMIVSLTLWYESCKVYNKILVVVSLVSITISSFPIFGSVSDKRYDELQSFIQRQNFDSKTHVAAPMMTFYELRPNVRNTYFYEIYPTRYINHIDYLIIPQPEKEISHPHYDYIAMKSYYNRLISDGYSLQPIDSITSPALIMYKVSK